MTMSDVAGWLDLSWDTIKTVVKCRLEKDYRRIGYRHVRRIAIDEIYLGKTHKYVTLVVDLDNGRIIWVGEGRGGDALREFWRRFKQSGGRLRAVAMDMSVRKWGQPVACCIGKFGGNSIASNAGKCNVQQADPISTERDLA